MQTMQSVRPSQGRDSDIKYSAGHLMFMAKQQGAKLVEEYFELEASRCKIYIKENIKAHIQNMTRV